MSNEIARQPNSPIMSWIGWILTLLIALALIASGTLKILIFQGIVPTPETPTPNPDWPADTLLVLGIVEVSCALIYLLPPTSILGAILIAGYMGGAIAVHARVHDYFVIQALIGVFAWLGIYLRCGRLRALIPFRT